jgi:hypothetical protein
VLSFYGYVLNVSMCSAYVLKVSMCAAYVLKVSICSFLLIENAYVLIIIISLCAHDNNKPMCSCSFIGDIYVLQGEFVFDGST